MGLLNVKGMLYILSAFSVMASALRKKKNFQSAMGRMFTMFMSISHHNARINPSLMLVTVVLTTAVAVTAHADTLRQATASEAKEAATQLSASLKTNHDFAEGMIAINAQKTLYWSKSDDGKLLVPVFIRFPGEPSGYCRLGTLSTNLNEPTLINAPEEVNSPDCKGFRDLYYLDVNGDGHFDVVGSITIKSNAFDGYVDVPVVYLSRMNQPGGYCYSAIASEALEPATMSAINKVKKALEREKQRRKIRDFNCQNEM